MRAAKRDANEREVIDRFKFHGWHVDQVNGQPYDLLCWRFHDGRWELLMVEVKSIAGRLTKSQAGAIEKGRPVRIVRNSADVDAIVSSLNHPVLRGA